METGMKIESRQNGQVSLQQGADRLLSLLTPLRKEAPLPAKPAVGFFTDTSICIGCKACEIACKQWNQLPASEAVWSGTSYDNTRQLGATTWRHVQFIEQVGRRQPSSEPPRLDLPIFTTGSPTDVIPETPPGTALPFFNSDRWLMHSD